MAKTAAEMVTLIDETIEAILTDKTATRSAFGRAWTALDLNELRAMRAEYQRLANASSISGGTKRPFKAFGIQPRAATVRITDS